MKTHSYKSCDQLPFDGGTIPADYERYIQSKRFVIFLTAFFLGTVFLASLSLGAAGIPVTEVVKSLLGLEVSSRHHIIVQNIRLPQAVSSMVAGAGLALAGAVMQAILRNPLGSPFTLGISHAAAFGAALAVMVLGGGTITSGGGLTVTSPIMTTAAAFFFSILASALIVAIASRRGSSPEIMILSGVALSALCTAGTMFLQFFADDVQLAAMVFWTFGDTARASWTEIGILTAVTGAAAVYFLVNGWRYNTIEAGEETAMGLGVNSRRLRFVGMLVSSLITAVVIAFLGIIGFVGLVVPHLVRRLIGSDHRFLLPASMLTGSLLLLSADTTARLILAPNVLPVSVLTAFLGAPVFLYLIIRGRSCY